MLNAYCIIILTAIVVFFLIDVISEIFNLNALVEQLPEAFRGIYDQEDYRKSQQYTRVTTQFGIISEIFDLFVLLAFWFAGGFNVLDQMLRSLGFGAVLTGVLFFGVLVFAKSLLGLPFDLYATFVIEERFGFNKTNVRTFWADFAKSLLLSACIGGMAASAIIAFFEYAGPLAWLWGWLALSVFSLLLTYLSPTYIMPLFNKFTPIGDGELKDSIFSYAKSVDFPLQEICVMDGSRRSTKSNAFFTGLGKNKKIALFDTLIQKHSVPELVAILAHEIGHFKKRHVPQRIAFGIAHIGVMFYLASFFIHNRPLFDAFGMEETSVYAGLLFFSLLFTPLNHVFSVFSAIWSRKHEYEADYYAAVTTGNPEAMSSALKKLSKDNLSNLTPHPFYVFLNYSHPPVLQRLESIASIGKS